MRTFIGQGRIVGDLNGLSFTRRNMLSLPKNLAGLIVVALSLALVVSLDFYWITNWPGRDEAILYAVPIFLALHLGRPRMVQVVATIAVFLDLIDIYKDRVPIGIWPLTLASLLVVAYLAVRLAAHREQTHREVRRRSAEFVVAKILAETTTASEALSRILQAICQTLDYDWGAFWYVDRAAGLLRCVEVWHRPTLDLPTLDTVSRTSTVAPGEGLPGQIWSRGHSAWIADILVGPRPTRETTAAQAGLRSTLGFPVQVGSHVLGVMEFFGRSMEPPGEACFATFDAIGGQIGQFVERKRAEDAEQQRAEELARSNDELQQFAYVASHDLQEPLRMVASYTQLLARRYSGKLDADADEFIGFAVDGATRMQHLIQDILAYSRVGTRGKEFAPTDCNALVDQVIVDLAATIEDSGAAVTREDLPCVIADSSQLGQVFQNLIANAIKYHGDEPPLVHVAAKRQGPTWLLTVRDNGIGIDPQFHQRIFVIFQRLHSTASYPGTGIGLAICKKIVERHGGRIWLESELGQGATFCFTLPDR